MAVIRRQNFLGQQRVDTPHLKSIESAVSHDFDQLINGLVIGENKSYVVRGLKINMPGSIGSSANGLQLLVENSAFLHGASDESGTFYTIPTGTPAEILSSTTNERVQGSFTPNTDNYVGIEFVRAVDDTTADQVYFWNPTTNIEITKTVPLAIIQDYKIIISTSSFGSNVLPIAVVQTDDSNNVISITDRRPLLYRLGTAGENQPNPFYTYDWSETRSENFYTSTSSTSDPFYGGDKVISNMKEFFDALMTELKLLKGTPFWYSASNAGSLYRNRQDLGSTAFTGKGSISHGIAFFNGQVAGMTTDVSVKAISLSVTLTADGIKDINTLINDHNIANESEPVYLISGDGSQIPTANIVLTSAPGRINWDSDVYLNFIGGRLRYKIKSNKDTGHITLTDNQVAYVKLVRGENIIPNLVFTNGGAIVTSVGDVNWTEDLEPGDFIKDASKGDEFYYQIKSKPNPFTVILGNPETGIETPFQEPSSGPDGFDAQYAFGVYETSAAPSTDRHVYVADRGSVPFVEDVFWLFFRADDGGSPQVYVRMLGGKELEQGEQREVSDNTSQAILNYIGAANESDNAPNYTDATGSSITNIHLIDSENLTLGMKRLEHRDDVIPRVRVIDLVNTSLPTGASVAIDGENLNNGDYVFFTKSAIEGLYKVSGVGTAIAFEKMHTFKGLTTPVNGDLIRVESGTEYFKTVWKRVSGYWKPLELKNATLEPTGFPNRTDSEISFDEISLTFTIQPKAPSDHFDIFSKGRVYRFKTAQSIQIPDEENLYFFYFNTDGTLGYSTTFDVSIIQEKIFVSTAYWDATNSKQILLSDERHGITMDGATHEYLHNKNGAVLTNGGTINFDPTADGSEDNDAQISLSDMVLRDEDIRIDIKNSVSPSENFEQILDPIAYIPVYYRSGALGNWRKDVATAFPVKQGSTTIQWNNPAGVGGWVTQDVLNNEYASMWIYATNAIEEPVIAIVGQATYSSLSQAQEGEQPNTLLLGALPTQEFKLLYRIIFHAKTSFANTPRAAIADVRDLRAVEDTFFAQASPNDHGLLSGLNDPDHGPTAVTTAGITKDGGLSISDVDVKQSLDTLNKLLGQLRIKPHPVNGNRVVITGANRILNSGTTLIQEIRNLVISFEGAEIDFSTGQIFKEDGVTSLGIDFVPEVIPAGEYLNYSITLIPSDVNLDNTISTQLIVIPAPGTNAVKLDAPKAPFAQGTKLGQVTVQEDAGGILPITEADILQLGTGGGGSGGTGDANELLERLKNRLNNYGTFEYMTPVIFSSVEEDLTDPSSTAEYSVVNSNYEFELTGNEFISVQMLDDEFLSEEIGLDKVELIHYWDLENIDELATYELSRDGGNNWQTVSMERVGQSDTYRGLHTFTEEPSNSFTQTVGDPVVSVEDFTDVNEISRQFTLAKTTTIKKITAEITKTGAATGYVYAVAVKDDGLGFPSTDPNDKIGQSSFVSISGLSVGSQNVDFNILFTQPADVYHIVFKTDSVYKTDYTMSGGAKKISVSKDGDAGVSVTNINLLNQLNSNNENSNDQFGYSVAIDGDYIVVGANRDDGAGDSVIDTGEAYVFKRNQGGANNWGLVKVLNSDNENVGDYFGSSVAISGDYIVVGAYIDDGAGDSVLSAGEAYVFKKDEGGVDNWGLIKVLNSDSENIGDNFGISTAISGDYIVVGAWRDNGTGVFQAGEVYVFKKDEGGVDNWGLIKTLNSNNENSGDNFGSSVAIDGDYIVVGAGNDDGSGDSTSNAGEAYVFKKDEGGVDNWGLIKTLNSNNESSGDNFGSSVAISGDYIVVGTGNDSGAGDSTSNAGEAYVFKKDEGGVDNWGLIKVLNSDNENSFDRFGWSVTIDGDYIVVGAYGDDGSGDSLNDAGEAYIFRITDSITSNGSVVYTLSGLELDLRVRITSGTDAVVSEGFGVFYKNDVLASPVDGSILRHVETFVGDVDNLSEFTISFIPDVRLMTVYEIGTGQAYRYGAWIINGDGNVEFPPNTFNKPETVTLEFLQIQGGSFDNSDRNQLVLAANHLGSTNPSLDFSANGRGIFLRTPNGTLVELTVDDDNNIAIYSV